MATCFGWKLVTEREGQQSGWDRPCVLRKELGLSASPTHLWIFSLLGRDGAALSAPFRQLARGAPCGCAWGRSPGLAALCVTPPNPTDPLSRTSALLPQASVLNLVMANIDLIFFFFYKGLCR